MSGSVIFENSADVTQDAWGNMIDVDMTFSLIESNVFLELCIVFDILAIFVSDLDIGNLLSCQLRKLEIC